MKWNAPALAIAAFALPGAAWADGNAFLSAFRLVQATGTSTAVDPGHDMQTKALLAKALKDSVITAAEADAIFDRETFDRVAGPDGQIDAADLEKALMDTVPESRAQLLPALRAHAELLTTSFDMIDPAHREAGAKLAEWIARTYRPGEPLHVTVVCTGNSRRSILGATMGNIAAAYWGMPEVRFHSGGTAPTAFNSRTASALKAIGVEVTSTGSEAPRGEPKTKNPVYRVRWGESATMEATEFSKLYSDAANPQSGFAALMVCSEADAGCPFVKGAAIRISMPYLDPKLYDDSPVEAAKYAERRDDMGRLMLSVFAQARQKRREAATRTQ